jgi:hypothetical protein
MAFMETRCEKATLDGIWILEWRWFYNFVLYNALVHNVLVSSLNQMIDFN